MLARLGRPIPDYFINNAKALIKERQYIAYPANMNYFTWYYAANTQERIVTSFQFKVKERNLTAHKLVLPERDGQAHPSVIKKAIVYMTGNCFFVAESMPKREALLRTLIAETKKAGVPIDYAFFCQDYRGRGFNQDFPEENYNDYPMSQDAEDQAALIKKLVEEEGYKPEDILLLGHSYGSAIALWAMYNLIKTEGVHYAGLKVYSDRGFGNPLDFPVVNFFLDDQHEAHQRLHQLNMMPDIFLHDIANQLPESFVINASGEAMLTMKVALTERLSEEDMPGRVWVVKTDNPKQIDPHLTEHSGIRLESILEVDSPHLMLAMMLEAPIQLQFSCQRPMLENGVTVIGYALKKNATPGQDDFIPLPPFAEIKTAHPVASLTLPIAVQEVSHFLARLHGYCMERAEQAVMSGLGGAHNRAWLSQSGLTGWSAKQQVEMAVRIMCCLANEGRPDVVALESLQQERGPHESGRLNLIFRDVTKFIAEVKKLQQFNEWVMTMEARREERSRKSKEHSFDLTGIFSPNLSIVSDWTTLEAQEPLAEEAWETLGSPKPTRV